MSITTFKTIVLTLLVTGVIIALTFTYLPLTRMVDVVYVSYDELIKLEEDRVKRRGEQQLFYGAAKLASSLTKEYADSYKDNKTIVLYTVDPVLTKGVHSISREVHEKVVEHLAKDKNLHNQDQSDK